MSSTSSKANAYPYFRGIYQTVSASDLAQHPVWISLNKRVRPSGTDPTLIAFERLAAKTCFLAVLDRTLFASEIAPRIGCSLPDVALITDALKGDNRWREHYQPELTTRLHPLFPLNVKLVVRLLEDAAAYIIHEVHYPRMMKDHPYYRHRAACHRQPEP